MRQTDTREHLLATGLRVLHERGFHACGVQEIVTEADIPKGSFYSHFESKERFGADVLGRYWEDRASRAAAILSDESRTPLTRLKAYFASKIPPRPSTTPSKGCMIGNFSAELASQSKLVRDRLGAVMAAWTRMLATCIRDAQAAGEIANDDDPETIAAFLIDAFEGAVLRTKIDQDQTPLRRFERIVFTRILI